MLAYLVCKQLNPELIVFNSCLYGVSYFKPCELMNLVALPFAFTASAVAFNKRFSCGESFLDRPRKIKKSRGPMKEILKFCTTMVYTLFTPLGMASPHVTAGSSICQGALSLYPLGIPMQCCGAVHLGVCQNLQEAKLESTWEFQTSDLISRFPLPVFLPSKVLEFQAKLNFSRSCCTTSIDKSCYIPSLTTDQ